MTTAGIQAPLVNFDTTTTSSTMNVAIEPTRLMTERPLPAGLSVRALEPEHAELRQGEAREHADRVERDQRRSVAVERDDQKARERGEEDDPVREHEAIASVGHLPGQEAVSGDDRRQPREVGECGVGGEDQDREGRELQHVVHERP